ncbi:MFS transporter [Candidatus Bathyarchaeota archaeon]|nr:MFS transporter [Candidatus Bathyarchaeota archaeon]
MNFKENIVDSNFFKWKLRILIIWNIFYIFYYLGRIHYGLTLPWIKEDLKLTIIEASVIASGSLWAYALGNIIFGRLSDKLGYKKLLFSASIFTALMNWIASFAFSFKTLLIPFIINGFIQAMGYAPGEAMVAQWWRRKEWGTTVGFTGLSASLSVLIVWIITGWFASNYGWRAAWRYPLLITLTVGVMLYLIAKDKPSDAGFPSYNDFNENNQSIKEKLNPYIYLLSNKKFLLICFVGILLFIGRYGLITWIPLYYAESGIALSIIPLTTITLPIGQALGAISAGFISDKVFKSNRYKTVCIYAVAGCLTLIALALTSIRLNPILSITLLGLGGFFTFGAAIPVFVLALEAGGREIAGTAVGIFDFFCYIGSGLQGLIIGFILYATNYNWIKTFIILGMLIAFSAILIFAARK